MGFKFVQILKVRTYPNGEKQQNSENKSLKLTKKISNTNWSISIKFDTQHYSVNGIHIFTNEVPSFYSGEDSIETLL